MGSDGVEPFGRLALFLFVRTEGCALQRFYDTLAQNPIIAAVKDPEGLEACLQEENIQVVFILFGDICTIPALVERVHRTGKLAFVHVDLIAGLSGKEIAVDFIHRSTLADGILSTRMPSIRRGRELGLHTVLRVFLIDSIALSSLEKLEGVQPEFIEIMPGVMPKVIRKVRKLTAIPVLAGGLIADKEDVMGALDAGAVAVSTTDPAIWRL